MATKKVGKAAALAVRKSSALPVAEKPFPKPGDVVWIDEWKGVIGIFQSYDKNTRTLYLSWDTPSSSLWQTEEQPFSPVEESDIQVLSPREVLSKMSQLVKARDLAMKGTIVEKVAKTLDFRPLMNWY